jgi:uncharacterized protein with PIN domain
VDELWLKLLIGLGIAASIGYEVWRHYFRRCSKCGGKIRLDEYKDSMGHNITKKVSISFWKGPRRNTETWKCQSCGDTEVDKYWSRS